MKEIGEKLKARREELGLSLQEVQQETKIRTKYLQALEDGDDTVIPGVVYVRGFIRSYADYLGLDGLALAQEYRELKQAESSEPTSIQPTKQTDMQVSQKNTPRRRKSSWNFGVVLILVIVLGASIAMINWWDANKETFQPEDPPLQAQPIEEPEPIDEPEPEPEPVPEPVVTVETVANDQEIIYLVSVTGGEIPGLELVATVTQRCWVEVRADGEVLFSGNLEAGENHVWTANTEIYLRAGNPAGLDLIVNEEHVGEPSIVGPKTIYVRWQE